tara:strand:+ start:5475 stop:5930 length:456 start_codon:yes stop_codon:yes gene_type:complete
MKIRIYDNFFTEDECKELIDLRKKFSQFIEPMYNVSVLRVQRILDAKYRERINKVSEDMNNSKIDYMEVVEWPKDSYKDLHFDTFKEKTTLSSVAFLNTDYVGGNLFFEDMTLIKPRLGRMVFFDGKFYLHGVSKIKKGTRYMLTGFYEGK